MANGLYDKGRQAFLEGTIAAGTDTLKVALVTNGYTPDTSSHQYYTSISASVVGTPQTLTSVTTTNGVLDATDVTFSAVNAGSTVNYYVIYKDTGDTATSPLLVIFDTATGLPLTTNGGDISIAWDNGSNKIFRL